MCDGDFQLVEGILQLLVFGSLNRNDLGSIGGDLRLRLGCGGPWRCCAGAGRDYAWYRELSSGQLLWHPRRHQLRRRLLKILLLELALGGSLSRFCLTLHFGLLLLLVLPLAFFGLALTLLLRFTLPFLGLALAFFFLLPLAFFGLALTLLLRFTLPFLGLALAFFFLLPLAFFGLALTLLLRFTLPFLGLALTLFFLLPPKLLEALLRGLRKDLAGNPR